MEIVKLGDVLKYEQPTKYIVNSTQYNNDFDTPVLTAGKSFLLGNTDEVDGIFKDIPVIIFDDFTTAIKFVDFPFKVKSSAMKILKPNKDIADIRFLFYRLMKIKINSSQHKRYWISKYSQLEIPLPTLPEQKRIAAILDEADKIRLLNKKLIKKYEALTYSLFLDMFGDPVVNPMGWEVDYLQDVADINMGQSPKGESYNSVGIGAPLLNGPTEFGKIYPIEKQWTSEPKKFCKKDDILFCVRGATAGRMNWSDKEYSIGRGLAAIRSNSSTSDKYIYMILEMLYDTFQRTSNGSTFINISRDDLRKVKIPRTSNAFQNQFTSRIEAIEKQKVVAEISLQKSEDLFNALLQRAFKGEL